MVHIKTIYCHDFEMKLLLVINITWEKFKESQFIHMAVSGDGL